MKNGRFTSDTDWRTEGRVNAIVSLTAIFFLFLLVFLSQANHPGRWSGLGSSSLPPRDRRVVRGTGPALGGDLSSQHLPHHYPPLHGRPPAYERHTAREERRCQGVLAQPAAHNPAPNVVAGSSSLSSTASAASAQASPTTPAQLQVSNPYPGSCSAAANHTAILSLSSGQPEGVSSSSESLTQGGGGGMSLSGGVRRGGGEHHPLSHIPRAVGASSSSSLHSLASRGSPSQSISSSVQAAPQPPTPSSASSSSSSSSTFTGRLGQPPRGPLSLHSYSRKNVFLQHSLHTSELQALTQRDS